MLRKPRCFRNTRYVLLWFTGILAMSMWILPILVKAIGGDFLPFNNSPISRVSSVDNIITIYFKHIIADEDQNKLLEQFVIESEAFGNRLIICHEAISRTGSHSPTFLQLKINLPFLQEYTGKIHLLDQKLTAKPPFKAGKIKPIVSFPIALSQREFDHNTEFSQMKCNGTTGTRWCEMRNVIFYRTKFVVSFPMLFEFPESFLSIGSRAPPFDITKDRLMFEPLVTHSRLTNLSENVIMEDDICYVVGRFHNSMMLWHVVIDFLVPLYSLILNVEGKFDNEKRKIFLRDSQEDMFRNILMSVMNGRYENIKNDPTNRFFKRVIVGLPKTESDPSPQRGLGDMVKFQYNYSRDAAPGLRDVVLKSFNIQNTEPNRENPVVVFISRTGSTRDATNDKQIVELMKEECPFCNVRYASFNHGDLPSQLAMIADASVVVGVHGSGLTHVMWMKRSSENFTSALVEILPYKYWCRKWYETAAEIAGVKYFSVMNTGRLLPEANAELRKCWKHEALCTELVCHDVLKDQRFEVELDVFNATWQNVVALLKRNV